ncbi:penicillin-binding protein 1C [Alcaligenaceae bacterium CGII-47]|nr:penicillin-binding protein 1C [Alcaligenaceae bacterium CGII-47]
MRLAVWVSVRAGIFVGLFSLGAAHAAIWPDFDTVRVQHRASEVRVLAYDGQLVQRVRHDYTKRQGDWVPLARISIALQHAVIRSEDQRFYEHAGVDWQAIAAAAWITLTRQPSRGASTLSMQLVALLDADLRRKASGRSLAEKFDQAMAARELEQTWTKAQILEAYLNRVAFRGELVGVDALARVMFQKQPSGLNAREAALAAVLLRGPNAPAMLLTQRSCALLREMGRAHECRGLHDFVMVALGRTAAPRHGAPGLAPHFSRLVLAQAGVQAGASPDGALHTSLDRDLQKFTLQSVNQHIRLLDRSGVTDAAVLVLDNRSGAVRAYVGSSGLLSAAAEVDHARALRQAGSTLKPFLYAMALGEQRLTAASLLNDSPLGLEGGGGLYVPQNYDKRYSGWVSVRTALASSLNIPAIRTLMMVRPDALAQRLIQSGLPLAHSGDYYGFSLALGSADVTLLSLTNAYRTLARGGRYATVRFGAQDQDDQAGEQIYTPQAAWVIGDILSDRQARARTFGLDSPLSTPFWSAVKTGTSKDMRDNWSLGWSQDYTVGVWVGNSAGASMRDVSGVSGAGPIWHDVMVYLHRTRRSVQMPEPEGLSYARVSYAKGLEPARMEVFIGDTAQADFSPFDAEGGQGGLQIAEPVDGTILALDPDIPVSHQRMRLRAIDISARTAALAHWYLDGEPYAQAGQVDWQPVAGQHIIELRDESGIVLDRVKIQVRGSHGYGAG